MMHTSPISELQLALVSRNVHGYHFTLGFQVYSRTDAGEWFREYAPGTWEPLQDTANLESLFERWRTANPPLKPATVEALQQLQCPYDPEEDFS